MNYLIFGGYGETGKHIIKRLSTNNQNSIDVVDLKDIKFDNVGFYVIDLMEKDKIKRLFNKKKYDYIINLVGSFTNDFNNDNQANFIISKNIIDSLIESKAMSRLLLVGSAAEYGNNLVKSTDEMTVLNPVSIYGLTKSYQTYYFRYINELKKTNILLARTFNVISRNQSVLLLIGNLYRQIEDYNNYKTSEIKLGHLENYRDYMHIDDVVNAYLRILEYGKAGEEYNVCSGALIRVYDLVERILNTEKIPLGKLSFKKDPDKEDHQYAGGNNSKLKELGWKQRIADFI